MKILANQDGKVLGSNNGTKAYTAPAPTGTISITENGTYDVSSYGTADVNVQNVDYLKQRISDTLVSYVVPNDITSIVSYSFMNCSNLAQITLHDRITIIGENAFRGTGIENIDIPGSIATVETSLLQDCLSLQWVKINKGTTLLRNYFVRNSASLSYIDMMEFDDDDTFPALGSHGLDGVSTNCVICVSSQNNKDRLSAMTNWSVHASRIQAGLPN